MNDTPRTGDSDDTKIEITVGDVGKSPRVWTAESAEVTATGYWDAATEEAQSLFHKIGKQSLQTP